MDWFPLTNDDDDDPPPLPKTPPPPPPGPLTQGLRQLRHEASHPHSDSLSQINESDDENVAHSSPILFTQVGEDESSLFRTANEETLGPLFSEEVEIRDSSLESSHEINEVAATPALSPPQRRLHSVVTRPLRVTPIHQRLRQQPINERLISLANSPTVASSSTPTCVVCHKADGRKKTIECQLCGGRVHSVHCGGFVSHRAAVLQADNFTCIQCLAISTRPLPLVPAPAVSHNIEVQDSSAETLPAALNDSVNVIPNSPIAASSPNPQIHARRTVIHSSPDHRHLATTAPLSSSFAPNPLPFSLNDICSVKIPVLRHLPKTARREYATSLNSSWNKVLLDPVNIDSWTLALAHAKLILFLPPGKKSFKEKAATIKRRIKDFSNGQYRLLWHNASRRPPGPRPSTAQITSNIRRATLLAQEGQYGQAAKALLSQGLDFNSQEAIQSMHAKHPQAPPPPPLPPPPASPFSFSSAEVLNALNSFHTLSAGGPSSSRPAHFKEAISSDRGNSLLGTMTRVINYLSTGKAPSAITPFLAGGNLFAAVKKAGGHRPIAVGETLRRWVAKCVAKKAISETAEYLSPNQLGVCVKGGAESIIHATAAIYNDPAIPAPDKWILQVDFDNAFNRINRKTMLDMIRLHCPKASAWAEYCYSNPSHLFFGENLLSSSTGAQQGDPLSILFFALVLQPLIDKIKEQLPSLLLNAWFLDDGTIVGKRQEIPSAFNILHSQGPAVGLHLNSTKCSIWCGDDDDLPASVDPIDPLLRGVPRASPAGIHLLGAPIGNIPFSRDTVSERVQKLSQIYDLLPSLNNSQIEFSIFRFCFSSPKLTYCFRTCEPSSLLPTYKVFDSLQLATFSSILGRTLDDDAHTQMFLPVKIGGAGLRSAVHHCPAAFIASVSQTRSNVDKILPERVLRRDTTSAFPILQTHSGNATYTDFDLLPAEFTQHSLSAEIDKRNLTSLLEQASNRNKSRLHSLNLPHAGDWIDAIPSPTYNLHLDSRSFSASMSYRLGLPLMPSSDCRADHCFQTQDAYGDHSMHCRDNHGMRAGRHDRIRDHIFNEAQQASLNPLKERPNLIADSQSRPADVYIENFMDGRKIAFDVSVTSPTQEAFILSAANTPGVAIEKRKQSKNRDHFEDCRSAGVYFQPLVVETFGGWDGDALAYLKKIARQAARRWGKNDAMEIKNFFQKLSVSLQRSNAALIVDRDVPEGVNDNEHLLA